MQEPVFGGEGADAVGAIQGNPALKEAYGMGKKFKGMYMQKCGLRDGSLVPVTALLAQGLTDSSFRYHLERQTVKSWNKTGNQ